MLLPNYTRFDEVSRRLTDSVIRYKGEPVYVLGLRYDPQTDSSSSGPTVFVEGEIYNDWLCMPPNLDNSAELMEWLETDDTRWDWWCGYYGDPRDDDYPMDSYFSALDAFDRHNRGTQSAPNRVDMCDIVAEARRIDTGEVSVFRLNDKDINLVPVQLGYVNYPRTAVHAERIPARNCYKQGLSSQSLRMSAGSMTNLSDDPHLAQTIRGEFPTLRECLAEMAGNEDINRRAFHRHFAVELDRKLGIGYLEYKDRRIGYSPDCNRWFISPKYSFMADTLKQHNMEIAS